MRLAKTEAISAALLLAFLFTEALGAQNTGPGQKDPAPADESCKEGDCVGGQGTRILPDKTEIKATFKGGLPEGPGQIRYPDG